MFNVHSGRLRHKVEIYSSATEPDEYGELSVGTLITSARCEVQVKSGDQLNAYGTTVTSSVITVLLRTNSLIQESHSILWNNEHYEIKHIRPDPESRGMVITAEKVGK